MLMLSLLCLPASTLLAHPPYVAPYKDVLTYSVAIIAGILCPVLLPKKWPIVIRVALGLITAIVCWYAGLMVSVMSSL